MLSAKATPRALELIEEAEFTRHEALTPVEKAKIAAPCYIPAGLLVLLSGVSTVMGTRIGLAKQAELLSLVTAGESMYERYRKKVEDKFGKDAERDVRTELAKERAEQLMDSYHAPNPSSVAMFDTGLGDELIWDSWNGRFLKSSETEILKQVAVFNVDTSYGFGTFFPVNGFYDLINAPTAMNGNDQGFNQEYKMEVEFNWDSERQVYKIMTFVNPPKHEFSLNTWR